MLDLCLCAFVALVEQDKREISELSHKCDVASAVAILLREGHSRDFDIFNKDEFDFEHTGKTEKALVRVIVLCTANYL